MSSTILNNLKIRESDVINGSIDHIDVSGFKTVHCYGLRGLTHLPLWPNVTMVWCSNCPLLVQLQEWPNVTYVFCSNCPKLTQLPLWPNVIEVNCDSCLKLMQLPLWPNIRSVSCYNCPKLIHLPLWTNVKRIDCELEKLHWFYNKTGLDIFNRKKYVDILLPKEKFIKFKQMNKCFDDNVFQIISKIFIMEK